MPFKEIHFFVCPPPLILHKSPRPLTNKNLIGSDRKWNPFTPQSFLMFPEKRPRSAPLLSTPPPPPYKRSALPKRSTNTSDSEKPLWHSHEYEVKSGVLFMPGVPGPIERQDLDKLAKTYGKAIHFWQVDKGDELPLGLPHVMMALTRDGQLYPNLARDMETRYGVTFEKERMNRASMEGLAHGIHPKANAAGIGLKTVLREIECKPSGLPSLEPVPRDLV